MKLQKSEIKVFGKGTELKNLNPNRAKRKLITQCASLNLAKVAADKGNYKQSQSYRNTFYCQNKLISDDKRLYGTYCKNRHCTLCNSIRKAEIINKYLPVIRTWPDPHFLTLTVKAVPKRNLKKWIHEGFKVAFKKILEKYKKRYQKGKCKKLIGVRSLECNFNPIKKTYNPHFHIITYDYETALILKEEWIKLWKSNHASPKAQFIRKVVDKESDLLEVVKYGSKIFTEYDVRKSRNTKGSYQICVNALDNIFTAMKGCRIFERFGFNLPKITKPLHPNIRQLKTFEQWEYQSKNSDWVNHETDELLTCFSPNSDLENIIENRINLMDE